jgi:hypothetical protein
VRLDASEAGTGTFWQERLDHATGPPCRPARQDLGRLADPFDLGSASRDPGLAAVVASVAAGVATVLLAAPLLAGSRGRDG